MRRGTLILALLLALALAACRGGGLVFKGTHEDQDAAILEKLCGKYPKAEFSCIGRSEGAVHNMTASDGTEFPVWTAPKSGGEFQVTDHYLEEWLAGKGFYDRAESYLREHGYTYEYGSYNHYDRHLRLGLGPLDSEEQIAEASKAVSYIKGEFDSLRRDFQEGTGCTDLMLYFHGSFTLDGEEHFATFHISMREQDVWDLDYPFDDYESCLRDCIEKINSKDDTPNID